MLCIQESKKEMIDRTLCQALWGILKFNGKRSQQLTLRVVFYVCGVKNLSDWKGRTMGLDI